MVITFPASAAEKVNNAPDCVNCPAPGELPICVMGVCCVPEKGTEPSEPKSDCEKLKASARPTPLCEWNIPVPGGRTVIPPPPPGTVNGTVAVISVSFPFVSQTP